MKFIDLSKLLVGLSVVIVLRVVLSKKSPLKLPGILHQYSKIQSFVNKQKKELYIIGIGKR